MNDVRSGTVNCIVVKDLSRFGRNYKEAGNYLEHIFPYLGVRFVAINDHFDTADKGVHDGYIVPLTNILNESYSRDISRKISSAIKTKELQGDFRGPFAPYGYSKCPIAALDVHSKVVPCSLQAGKSCVAFHILADKDAVLITTILIKSTNLNKLTIRFDKYIIATVYGNYFRFLCDKIILTNTSQG